MGQSEKMAKVARLDKHGRGEKNESKIQGEDNMLPYTSLQHDLWLQHWDYSKRSKAEAGDTTKSQREEQEKKSHKEIWWYAYVTVTVQLVPD